MSRGSILKVLVRAVVSILSSKNTRIGELESKLAWKGSELDLTAAEGESTKRHLHGAEGEDSLLQEQA